MVWTKLIAVNRILRAGGENPVNTLASTSGDALMAEAILDEVNYEVQLPGLAQNSEEIEFTPNDAGEIEVDDTVLHIQCVDTQTNDVIVQRGASPAKLYNVTKNSYDFSDFDTLLCRVVYGLPYEELAYATQLYVADEAARRYQQVAQGDPAADAMLREIWFSSRAKARAQDMRSRGANIFGRWGSSLPWYAAKRTLRSRWR